MQTELAILDNTCNLRENWMKLALDWRCLQENHWPEITLLMLRLVCGVQMGATKFTGPIFFSETINSHWYVTHTQDTIFEHV
jgi:hypothetical protein